MAHVGRFRFQDRPARVADTEVNYQALAAVEENRIVKAAAEQFRLATATTSVAGVGEQMIREGQQAMSAFKKASARRWGRESSAAASEDRARTNDKSLPRIKRFAAASRLFRGGR